ncbi:MAG: putative hydrolase [Ilumatobacteraceae bacterium]|nr:putative hydrolase [Ilumatobacteraceae bacterium]
MTTPSMSQRLRRVVMWTVNRKFTSGSAAVIFNGAGELLLVRERFRDRQAWGLPGGYMKRGETHDANVRRELREELLIDVDSLAFVGFFPQERIDHIDALYTVTLEPTIVPRAGRELQEVRWFRTGALPAAVTPLTVRALRLMFEATGDERLAAAVPTEQSPDQKTERSTQ